MVKKSTGLGKATDATTSRAAQATTPGATPAASSGAPGAGARKAATAPAGDRTLEGVRGRLVAEQEQLLEQLREIEDATSSSSRGDISGDVSFDEDSVDAGSFTSEREKDLSIAQNVRDLLEKIARALDKIEDGTYGICESCGQPIEAARLKALPHALLCLSCKKAEERR
jgi:DnaK suppressor protein